MGLVVPLQHLEIMKKWKRKLLNFIVKGEVGSYYLLPKYRPAWYYILGVLFLLFMFTVFFPLWDSVIDFFNYLVWGK